MKLLRHILWAATLLPFAPGVAGAQDPVPEATEAEYTDTRTMYEATLESTVTSDADVTQVETTVVATQQTCGADAQRAADGSCTISSKDTLETGLDDPDWTNVPDPCPPGDYSGGGATLCASLSCAAKIGTTQTTCAGGYALDANGCQVPDSDGCPTCCTEPTPDSSCMYGYELGSDGCPSLDDAGAPICATSATRSLTSASTTNDATMIRTCDDGGVGPAPCDGGVCDTELRPFLLSGDLGGPGECAPDGVDNANPLRPLSGGTRVVVENTNFTAYDFAGNEFDENDIGGNVEIEIDSNGTPSEYAVLMQR